MVASGLVTISLVYSREKDGRRVKFFEMSFFQIRRGGDVPLTLKVNFEVSTGATTLSSEPDGKTLLCCPSLTLLGLQNLREKRQDLCFELLAFRKGLQVY